MKRTNTCGELNTADLTKKVVLKGWVNKRRDHGGIIFIDLRDRYGITQIVFDPEHDPKSHKLADDLRREFVVEAHGKVRPRPKEMINPKLRTGEIEVIVDELEILAKSETPPIEIDDRKITGDELRLKYRYLDLRRPEMQKHLLMRHKAAMAARKFLSGQKFLEIETPILIKSTPEGARDYVVPSRVNPGKFYALPQSPQIYKQILMNSGVDRYFQLARCLRDEDLRSDRQPEHTQCDLEMSFIDSVNDVHEIVEGIMSAIWKECIDIDLQIPFPKIKYDTAMNKYGTDKPDIRFGLELLEVTELMKKSEFSVFKSVIEKGGMIKCLPARKLDVSRKKIEGEYTDFVGQFGAKGLAWMKVTEGKLDSNIVKYFPEPVQKELLELTEAYDGDVLLFVADKPKIVNEALANLRLKIGDELGLRKDDEFKFCWVTDFPLFEWNEEDDSWEPAHHMFCMPSPEWVDKIKEDPGKVMCTQYDLVLNGWELGSGSIRINIPQIQKDVMEVIGMSEEEANQKFGFLLESFKYGCPPHAGIGIGFDRTVALLLGHKDIREVMAFPKNKAAQNPMDDSPSDISKTQLKELHLKLNLPENE